MVNQLKTEFLLTGRLQQLSKIINPLFYPLHNLSYRLPCKKISASTLTPFSLCPSRLPHFQILVTIILVIFTISDTSSTSSLPPASLYLLFIHHYIIVIYAIIHFPSSNINASNKLTMHKLVPSPELVSTYILLLLLL